VGTKDVIRVPETRCLECGCKLDAIGTMDGTRPDPRPGEPVACVRCGAVATFENGRIRGFTDKEVEDLLCDEAVMNELAHLTRAVHLIRHMQN
jgi:hypothetical protein